MQTEFERLGLTPRHAALALGLASLVCTLCFRLSFYIVPLFEMTLWPALPSSLLASPKGLSLFRSSIVLLTAALGAIAAVSIVAAENAVGFSVLDRTKFLWRTRFQLANGLSAGEILSALYLFQAIPIVAVAATSSMESARLVLFAMECALSIAFLSQWKILGRWEEIQATRLQTIPARFLTVLGLGLAAAGASTALSFTYVIPRDLGEQDMLKFVESVVLAAILFEVVYRSALQRALAEGIGPHLSIALSSLCFVFYHFSSGMRFWDLLFYSTLAGMTFQTTKSLWAPMIAHSVANAATWFGPQIRLWVFGTSSAPIPLLSGYAAAAAFGLAVLVPYARSTRARVAVES